MQADKISITVTQTTKNPVQINPPGTAYAYLNITPSQAIKNKIQKAFLTFTVNRTWTEQNQIDPSTISLYHYKASWQKLPTSLISQNNQSFAYQSEIPGFSIFAITGQKIQPKKTCIPNWSCTPWSPCINNTQTRTCTDLNQCPNATPPIQTRTCTEEKPFKPSPIQITFPLVILILFLAFLTYTLIVKR